MDCFTIERHLFIQKTTDITDLSALHGLRSVGGYIGISDNQALKDARLPNLEETGEGLVVEGNLALQTIRFASLREVKGYLHVFNNQALQRASFPMLFGVGHDTIFAGNDALTSLELPKLTCVMGRFIFEHSNALHCLCLPNLVVVNGDFLVHYNGALASLSAPSLTTVWGNVVVQRDPNLQRMDLSCLEWVAGDIRVLHNRLLPQCRVDDFVSGVSHIGGAVITGDNAQTCPATPRTAEDVDCPACTTTICAAQQPVEIEQPPAEQPSQGNPEPGSNSGEPGSNSGEPGSNSGEPGSNSGNTQNGEDIDGWTNHPYVPPTGSGDQTQQIRRSPNQQLLNLDDNVQDNVNRDRRRGGVDPKVFEK